MGDHVELLDVYDDNGVKTGKVVKRGVKDSSFNKGEHIAVSIIYIENDNDEFLIQRTSRQKGGIYSSTGGHVNHNEKPIDTIKREVKEELGIDIGDDNIIDLGYINFDFPIRFVFYLKRNIDLNNIVLQKEEVESVSYMTCNEIINIIEKGLMHKAHAKMLERVLEYKNNIDL